MPVTNLVKTIDQAATERGYVVYDTALPQTWVDQIKSRTGIYVIGHFVWCYDVGSVFGWPAPVTHTGAGILKDLNESTEVTN